MSKAAPDWTSANVHSLPTARQADDDEIDIGEIFALFWHRKWLVLAAMLISMILGIFYVQSLPRLYEAEAKLILESQDQNATGLDSLVPGISDDDAEMNSQIEVIKSRKLVGQVVDKLLLIEDKEYNTSLREPTFIAKGIKWVRSQLDASPGTNPSDGREVAIDQLTTNLKVSVLPKTHVFRISLETWDPLKSVKVVNALSEAFESDQVNAKKNSNLQAADWLGKKVTTLAENLSKAEADAAAFRTQTDRVVTEEDVAQSNGKLKNARGRLDSFRSSLEDAGSVFPITDRDRAQLNSFKLNIAELEAIVEKQTIDLLTIRQLDREAKAAGTIYEHFAQRLNEIQVQQGLQESDVRVLSAAVPRYKPTRPRKTLTVAIFGVLGLILSIAYILLRKLMDRSFRDPAELQKAFGIPVIGAIPRAATKNRKTLLTYAIKRPSSAIMEAIRDLRTSLLVSETRSNRGDGRAGTVLVLTSSIPAEGKTTSSILLALNSAALDKKVLLVECDLRRSTFKTYFGPRMELGLLHAIEHNDDWESAVWTKSKTNMDIIFGGTSKGRNAADIFASEDFSDFIEEAKQKYDLVVLDSPPVLPVPDARLIAKISDKILYVVHSASTPASTVAAGLRLFENIGIKPDGLVMTQITKNAGGYGYSGYGYGSEYYKN
jgi:capsular exopolysaccharide synthesis family protein